MTDCPRCAELAADPLLIGACASVGIEHAMSTQQMLIAYLQTEHRPGQDGHVDRLSGHEEERT